MKLLPASTLPDGPAWSYGLKFDGFRGVAAKRGKEVRLFSRNKNDLSNRFQPIVDAISSL
jgi:bifunctional non-homologous end joining protein LigD